MLKHLSFSKIADLAEGRLAADERNLSAAHTAVCSRCAAKLNRLENVLGLMRADESVDAPPQLVAHTINLFRTRPRESRTPSLARRLVAALSFDSLQMSPAYGVRSGQSAASTRQLLYSAEEYDLDLRLTETSEGWVVLGQVLGQECAGAAVELAGAQEATVRADVNEQCEFRLPAVPPGSYQLSLRFKDLEIEIPQLELRA